MARLTRGFPKQNFMNAASPIAEVFARYPCSPRFPSKFRIGKPAANLMNGRPKIGLSEIRALPKLWAFAIEDQRNVHVL